LERDELLPVLRGEALPHEDGLDHHDNEMAEGFAREAAGGTGVGGDAGEEQVFDGDLAAFAPDEEGEVGRGAGQDQDESQRGVADQEEQRLGGGELGEIPEFEQRVHPATRPSR
jgi:hypothetical protein